LVSIKNNPLTAPLMQCRRHVTRWPVNAERAGSTPAGAHCHQALRHFDRKHQPIEFFQAQKPRPTVSLDRNEAACAQGFQRAIGPDGVASGEPICAPAAAAAVRAIALAGPTASGKSALALAAAARWPVEIISVDSAQVYRGLDIGTAKPSAAERAAVPHHLINILEATEAYSAAQFVTDARRLIGEINARGRSALLVGGTMLYFKALIDGLDAMPAANPAVRAALDARAAAEGWPALHAELARIDPATAARLPSTDAQRIQRALEVWQVSGQPLSSFHRRDRASGLDLPLLALEPVSRAWLHQRIALRFAAMLDQGLVAEVAALRARSDLRPDLPALRCVGYRQTWTALDAAQAAASHKAGDDDRGSGAALSGAALTTLREQGIAATRQLAKRQLTWLRGMPRQVLACDAPDATDQGLAALARLLAAQDKPAPAPGRAP
jgi:tRNA dimethylallyltransferase